MSDLAKGHDIEAALTELPLFPLTQVVLFPHALLPLHVFEPRYRALLKDALATHKVMAVALVLNPNEVDERSNPRIADIAGAGLIVEHQSLADGRSNILLHGQGRVHIDELPFVPPYRRARATILRDTPAAVSASDRAALVASATAFAADVHRRDKNFSFRMPQNLEPGTLADLCAHHLIVDTSVRQALLQELDPNERVQRVTAELAAQHATLLREAGGLLH
jgi:Lon protease-like protein